MHCLHLSLSLATVFTLDELVCLCLWLPSSLLTSLFVSIFGYCLCSWQACLSLSLATVFTLDELVCLCLWLLSLLLTSLFVSFCFYIPSPSFFFGRPTLRFPSGCHVNAIVQILLLSIRKTWPIQLHLFSVY